MKFNDILPGEAGRTGEEQNESLVDDPALPVAQRAQGRLPRRGHESGRRFDDESNPRARDAQDRDAGAAGCRGERDDGRLGRPIDHGAAPALGRNAR